ncbi:MAG: 3-phosphoshikimate 1-carboxyvinyltransferase, partial [Terriglobia bacterium]
MTESIQTISRARRICGEITLPGDKSISHRYAMLGAIAGGTTEIENFASSADCQSTLACVTALGIAVERQGGFVRIKGKGLRGLSAPQHPLDAGNSG